MRTARVTSREGLRKRQRWFIEVDPDNFVHVSGRLITTADEQRAMVVGLRELGVEPYGFSLSELSGLGRVKVKGG